MILNDIKISICPQISPKNRRNEDGKQERKNTIYFTVNVLNNRFTEAKVNYFPSLSASCSGDETRNRKNDIR